MRVVKIKGAEKGKERVCAYVRVSTDKEDQLHSFFAQSEYWKKKLSENKSYQYIGIFADEGLSGKSMKNRTELNEMLDLARKGQIDRIFVKSIARFARNYIETIEMIRELRQLNIPVNFDEEGIDTNDPKCNLLLNVYASLAEEELRSMSENQKWSVRKRFENGSVEIGKMYGYEYIDGKLIINTKEAEAVSDRQIGKITEEEYIKISRQGMYNVDNLNMERLTITAELGKMQLADYRKEEIIKLLNTSEKLETFDETIFKSLVREIKATVPEEIEICYNCGITVKEQMNYV